MQLLKSGYKVDFKENKVISKAGLLIVSKEHERIQELEQKIEKMKCCFNCENYADFIAGDCEDCINKNKWELEQ